MIIGIPRLKHHRKRPTIIHPPRLNDPVSQPEKRLLHKRRRDVEHRPDDVRGQSAVHGEDDIGLAVGRVPADSLCTVAGFEGCGGGASVGEYPGAGREG